MAIITVMEHERAVRYVEGRIQGVLGPGRHRYRRSRTTLVRIDMRPRQMTIAGQEMLTSDGVSVRVTAIGRIAVTDPTAYCTVSQDPHAEVYSAVQQSLRTVIAGLSLDSLLSARTTLGSELLAAVQADAGRVGMAVEDVVVRDVMLPGELRRAYAEILLARERGRAELERARGETAALRSLANAARLLEEHPALLRLRTLQVAEQDGTELRITL